MPSFLMRLFSSKLPAKTKRSKIITALAGFVMRSQFDLNQRKLMRFVGYNSNNVKFYRKIS